MIQRHAAIARVYAPAVVVILPLIAASWLPPHVSVLLRNTALFAWGVGAVFMFERMLFSKTRQEAVRAMGFVRTGPSTVFAALVVSVPMWLFLPGLAWIRRVPLQLRPDWLALLAGV